MTLTKQQFGKLAKWIRAEASYISAYGPDRHSLRLDFLRMQAEAAEHDAWEALTEDQCEGAKVPFVQRCCPRCKDYDINVSYLETYNGEADCFTGSRCECRRCGAEWVYIV